MRGRVREWNHSGDPQQNQRNEEKSEFGGEVYADGRTAEKTGVERTGKLRKIDLKELAFKLSGEGREKEFIEAASNPNLLEKLYQEYGI